ncbi:ADP-heptose--LPS heptosyltransferase 2 [Pigmentiphaga humi]|uniref:ADP-heptose--LPS heptosyltransferase 2 n=1 Tax=Pigmentiphaga humi TaxID=2478468 RepID=A0A3P4B6L7_9BURK|nr:glycosyltransferase family 9 protein [Pigmentiphaga humi]VCU71166.1 ADP-heptose--LPS heptosyltransferase 2 [Pigmentiphaga humi]
MSSADPVYVRLPNWVGDACMCLPALRLLQRAGCRLALCGRPWARDLLAGLAPAGFVELGRSFGENRQALRQAAAGQRNVRGLVFTNSLSSAALFRLAGIAAAGYRGDGRSLLLRWALPKPREVHEVEVFYRLAHATLLRWQPEREFPPVPEARLALPLTPAHHAAAAQVLAQAGMNSPFVLLAPIATGLHHGKSKAWPLFGELARTLAEQGVACVACPPPHEIAETRDAVPAATLLPPLGLGAFAALTTRAGAVVCNDSGTSHVAAAAGARQVTLFGVTRRERTGPWSPDAVCLGAEGQWPALPEVLGAVQRLMAGADS